MLPLAVHRALLEKWRGAMDLVGPGPIEPHFVDAESAVRGIGATGEWVDLGSGAGFPGIALAVAYPQARVRLVERREKRATFLEEVIAQAGLSNVTVDRGDARELPAQSFDGIISRAYKTPPEMIEEARRLLRPGGLLVLLLAREPAPDAPDFKVFHVERYLVEGRPRQAVALRYEPR